MKGAISKRRHRPSENTEYSSQDHILHSTAINDNVAAFDPYEENSPVMISAPSGYPYFTSVLQQQGFFVVKPRNHLQVDQRVFRQALGRFLQTAKTQDRLKFLRELEGFLSVPDNLQHSMTPTLHPDEVLQESLLHSILNIPELRKAAMDVLFPAIMDASCTASSPDDIDNLENMLGQLRWIEYPNVESCISFLIGTIEGATNKAKLIIFKFLPDIIPDSHHSELLPTLKDLLATADSPIVSAIMECLSSLDISTSDWADNQNFAITQLLNASLQDFPAYFSFLFKTEDNSRLAEIITELRANLDLVPLGGDRQENELSMVRIVEKIRFCISINSKLVPVWITQITQDLDEGEENRVKPLDLTMILIFIDSFKEASTLLRRICANEKLTVKLLDYIITHNLPILSQVLKTFLQFCDSVLWNAKEVKAHSGMKQILVQLFISLSPTEIQDIGYNLICVLTHGDMNARTTALEIFSKITLLQPTKLLPFVQHLMDVLEGNKSLSTHQVRTLMHILASLAHVPESPESEKFGHQYTILLRKYLTHSRNSDRCLGVVGSLASIHHLATRGNTTGDEDRIRELLHLAWSYVQREDDSCCLFFDEFSGIAKELPRDIIVEFQELMSSCFMDSWSVPGKDVLEKLQNRQPLTLKEQFLPGHNAKENDDEFEFEGSENYSTPSNRSLFVFEERPLGMNPRGIPAHARAVFQLASNRKDVETFLTQSLLFPEINRYYKNPAELEACSFVERQNLGLYLVTAINFFRECISAFIGEEDEVIQIYVWYRLNNVIFLQQLLVHNIQHFPALPTAFVSEKKVIGHASSGDGPSASTDFKKPKLPSSGAKKKGVRGKKRKQESKADDNVDDANENGGELNRSTISSVQPPEISLYLRQLDPAVFKLLQAPLKLDGPMRFDDVWQQLSVSANTSRNVKRVLETVKHLYPDALSLLLMEICQRSADPETTFSLLDLEELIKWITRHLNTIVAEFEGSSQLRGIRKLEEGIQLILNTLSAYFEKVLKLEDLEQRERFYGEILSALSLTSDIEEHETEAEDDQIEAAVSFLKRVSGAIKKPARALDHLKAFSNFQALFPDNEVAKTALVSIAETYMNADWKLSSSQVDFMLKTWVLKSAEPMAVLRTVTSSIIDPQRRNLASCTGGNFHNFYSVVFQLLAQHVVKNGKSATASGGGVEFWTEAVLMFKDLVFVSETHRNRNILTPLIKHAGVFIDSFNINGTRILPTIYQENLPEFKKFLRNLQAATRKLQIVCEHSKVVKDTKMIRNVPNLKRALEGLVFRVRELFTINRISDVFSLGALRHRDMDGEEMSSQPFNRVDPDFSTMSSDDLEESADVQQNPEDSSSDSDLQIDI